MDASSLITVSSNLTITGYNIRVPASVWVPDATPNHTLVELTDGSGDHYAVLAVLHELHCLVKIY